MHRHASRATVLAGATLLLVAGWSAPSHADWWKWRGSSTLQGSGHIVKQSREVDDFDAIRLEGVATIHIKKGDAVSVEVETDDNIIDLVETTVARGRLVVSMDEDQTVNTEDGIHVYVTMKSLEELDLEGVGSIDATGLDEEELRIDVKGVGGLELEGRVDRLDLVVKGVGNIDLRDLTAREARVRHSGVGNVDVRVEEDLDARVSGVGSIRYYGDPKHVERREDGMGRVTAARR